MSYLSFSPEVYQYNNNNNNNYVGSSGSNAVANFKMNRQHIVYGGSGGALG